MAPQRDLIALLKQTTAVPIDQTKIMLKSFFIYVDEMMPSQAVTEHERDLMQEYQGKDESMKYIFESLLFGLKKYYYGI